jgi:hypothetical protein
MGKITQFPTKPFEEWTVEDMQQALKAKHEFNQKQASDYKKKKKAQVEKLNKILGKEKK